MAWRPYHEVVNVFPIAAPRLRLPRSFPFRPDLTQPEGERCVLPRPLSGDAHQDAARGTAAPACQPAADGPVGPVVRAAPAGAVAGTSVGAVPVSTRDANDAVPAVAAARAPIWPAARGR